MCRGALSCGNIGANMMLWQIEASCENWRGGVNLKKPQKNKKMPGVEEKEQMDTPRRNRDERPSDPRSYWMTFSFL